MSLLPASKSAIEVKHIGPTLFLKPGSNAHAADAMRAHKYHWDICRNMVYSGLEIGQRAFQVALMLCRFAFLCFFRFAKVNQHSLSAENQ